jgi:hypothetical protein
MVFRPLDRVKLSYSSAITTILDSLSSELFSEEAITHYIASKPNTPGEMTIPREMAMPRHQSYYDMMVNHLLLVNEGNVPVNFNMVYGDTIEFIVKYAPWRELKTLKLVSNAIESEIFEILPTDRKDVYTMKSFSIYHLTTDYSFSMQFKGPNYVKSASNGLNRMMHNTGNFVVYVETLGRYYHEF